jgi:hypothetical protein
LRAYAARMNSRRFFYHLLLMFALLIAACGGATVTTTLTVRIPASELAPPGCHHRLPAQMGECVRQGLEREAVKPSRPALGETFARGVHVQGIDISRYQPHPDFRELYREGIRFVIVQAADNNCACNPFFDSQVRAAHEVGMRVGVYVYVEGAAASEQAAALERVAAPERALITLGAWVDAEQADAYPRACGIAGALGRAFWIVGVYASPGTWPGGSCVRVWPAEWGGGIAYPPTSWARSAIELRQWCGTCQLAGVGEVDRDEDLGALALAQARSKRPNSVARDRVLVAYWTAERRRVLAAYHRARCTARSRRRRCRAWRGREHVLWRDIARV